MALDVDPAAEAEAQRLQAEVGSERFRFHRVNFSDLGNVVSQEGQADGLLLDLGISSPQVDQAERGFSFQQSGPLDMRMDPTTGMSAADLVNNLSEPELRNLLRDGGEDRDPGKIARGIVRARPLGTTADLATAVCRATRPARPGIKHPATRTFLALRRAVNREGRFWIRFWPRYRRFCVRGKIGRIDLSLGGGSGGEALDSGSCRGRKREMGMAFGLPNAERWVKALGEEVPSEEEISKNPRARSARLRGAERLGEVSS